MHPAVSKCDLSWNSARPQPGDCAKWDTLNQYHPGSDTCQPGFPLPRLQTSRWAGTSRPTAVLLLLGHWSSLTSSVHGNRKRFALPELLLLLQTRGRALGMGSLIAIFFMEKSLRAQTCNGQICEGFSLVREEERALAEPAEPPGRERCPWHSVDLPRGSMDCLQERWRWLKSRCAFPQAQDSPCCSPKLTTCCVIGCFCHPRAFSQCGDVFVHSCLCSANQDILLCFQSPQHATPFILRDVLAAERSLLGGKDSFVRTCSLSRMSGKFFQSASTKSLTEALHYKPMDSRASILTLCSRQGLRLTCKWQYMAENASWKSSMARSHPVPQHSKRRIIGGLTEFPCLGPYLYNLLVWMVSHSSLTFLILLKCRKRFWIAFFSQVVLKPLSVVVKRFLSLHVLKVFVSNVNFEIALPN